MQVSRKASLYRQLQKQKQEVQEKEFQDLIERGLNPYEIHRKKDIEEQVRPPGQVSSHPPARASPWPACWVDLLSARRSTHRTHAPSRLAGGAAAHRPARPHPGAQDRYC